MNLSVSIDPNIFDPGIIEVVVLFFAACGKYAFFFAILGKLINMLVSAASGKEKFI